MGKHDDDDDEKSAYVSNARTTSGGGGKGGEDEADAEGETLSPVIRAFCHHVVCDRFRKELDAFFSAECDDFEDADADSEQRLEWTPIFNRYVAMVEMMLEDFCGQHSLEPEGVFTMVQRACRSGMLDDEFLPAILGVTDYAFFVEQMGLMATEAKHVRLAQESAAVAQEEAKGGSGGENLSGIWRTATKDKKGHELTDVKGGLERYLLAVGVPRSLHNLFRGTLFSKKGLVIVHDDAAQTFTLVAETITGRHKQRFALDGRSHDVTNQGGTKTAFTARAGPGGTVVVRNDTPSGLPLGSAIQQTWLLGGPDLLQCTVQIERPKGNVMHEFFYARSQPKAKKQPRAPGGGGGGGGGGSHK